jgi:hypothetical protein
MMTENTYHQPLSLATSPNETASPVQMLEVMPLSMFLSPDEQESPNQSFRSPDHLLIDLRDRPAPDMLRVLAIGSPQVVDSFVMTVFHWGYARPEDWSRPLPTINPGEVMRILTKRVTVS